MDSWPALFSGQQGESPITGPAAWPVFRLGLVSGQTGLACRLANTQATWTQATGTLATRVTDTLASWGQTYMSWLGRNILPYVLERGWGPF